MEKAAEAFRTISEVADEIGIAKHVLRFWEVKFGHIRPMKRGGGRRYYRPEDMELLKGIRHLLYREGYTIKGVQKILREQGLEVVKALGRGEELPDPQVARSAVLAPHDTETPNAKRAAAKVARGEGRPAAMPATALDEPTIRAMISTLEECRQILNATTRSAAA